MPVLFPSEDGHGYTRDVCAEGWAELHGGNSSNRNARRNKHNGAKEEGMRFNNLGAAGPTM